MRKKSISSLVLRFTPGILDSHRQSTAISRAGSLIRAFSRLKIDSERPPAIAHDAPRDGTKVWKTPRGGPLGHVRIAIRPAVPPTSPRLGTRPPPGPPERSIPITSAHVYRPAVRCRARFPRRSVIVTHVEMRARAPALRPTRPRRRRSRRSRLKVVDGAERHRRKTRPLLGSDRV
jgi:hypothetical protein